MKSIFIPPHRRQGFTLIELLTVIAIIGILAAILMPTVSRVRISAQKARCVSNLRQIGVALINYAQGDKQQRLPTLPAGSSYLPWDVDRTVITSILGTAGKEILYCPSGAPNQQDLWATYAGYAATQYVLLLQSSPATASADPFRNVLGKNLNLKLQQSYLVDDVEIPASRRELAVDAAVRAGPDYTWSSPALGNRTNHMNGKLPDGVNVVFMDGHVKWRPFSEMKWDRTIGTPGFGW